MAEKKFHYNYNDSSDASKTGSGVKSLGINCDMGEGIGNDEAIMPFIHCANIACGYHAGDAVTIRQTIEFCAQHNVAAGAHISFLDKENFGRSEMHLDESELHDIIFQQLSVFYEAAEEIGVKPIHVKPHGALYNLSARDPITAAIIAAAVEHFDPSLVLFGLSDSHSITEAKNIGLQTASEVFADRTYEDDGSLTLRSQPNALITSTDEMLRQVFQMIHEHTVTAVSGKKIPVTAETICIHGDGGHAVEFARALHAALKTI